MNTIPVLLAGGIGERFWPFSRTSSPKQLLPIISKKPMIEETFDRISPFCTEKVKPLIITGKTIASKIETALEHLTPYDCIIEPIGKNTAPAVAIAAAWIKNKYGEDSVMVVLSADHSIKPKDIFIKTLNYGVEIANSFDKLLVMGIHPTRPDTGYGYIELGEESGQLESIKSYNVNRFVEKPSLEKAIQYIESKKYLWNSGMFIWKTSVILEEFKKYMPLIHESILGVESQGFNQRAIDDFYLNCEKQSIDYGIMEQSKRVCVVEGSFQWDDIGSWESIHRVLPQNTNKTTASGNKIYERDCTETIVVNNSNLSVATIGLKNTVVVTVDDAVMVITRDKLPEFKKYLTEMKNKSGFPNNLF
ncbi:MAG: mannose-1-phosphate guanylyltransferase [Chitinispirillia bacterium]|jgi:mannose-1-phosphate guanylyltransferase